jgi:putative transcriptional regulator
LPSPASALLAALLLALPVAAQQDAPPNSVLLVAKPELADPNFRRTVVLVTQTAEAHTVGVILNRPTGEQIAGQAAPVYAGGPVMPRTMVALFEADAPPEASAFRVLERVYLSMHPENIAALLAKPPGRLRLFAGFSGWAPRQLESELAREGWYVLPASEAVIFRNRTEGLWEELLDEARNRGRRKPA